MRLTDGVALPFAAPPKAASLLGFLLLHRGPVTRDVAAFALWPDDTESDARANLRRHLHLLTKALPPALEPWILSDTKTLRWNDRLPVIVDVDEFRRSVATGAGLRRAIELYGGDLLESSDEEWVHEPREVLLEQCKSAYLAVVAQLRAERSFDVAIGYAKRLLAKDPYREDALRQLISIKMETGDRAGALAEYREFAKRLRAELDVEPMRETTALAETLDRDESFASPRSPHKVPAPVSNLPEQLTALIGREEDLADVKALVEKHRLVTLSGSGGVGKTRVALQIGSCLNRRYADGVWFADLAPIRDPELVSSVVAKALNITAPEGHRLDDIIPQTLKRKKLLLILDNCEQVIDAAASLAKAILSAAPDIAMVATSREALRVPGEVVYRLPSLAVPAISTSITSDEALDYGALSLFVERARAADARFALTDGTAPIVAAICRRLDGIPLAIELAAARVKVLSIPNLAQRLNDRFKILTGGSRTALPRQQTLTALLDWSYDLLSAREQSFFDRLGIFAGSFTLEAATAVCGGDDVDQIDVFDLLSSLTDKSLIVAETGGQQARYRLLETTRAYAYQKLMASGGAARLARRHAEHFCREAQAADSHYSVESTSIWLMRVEADLDNYRSVLEWALTAGKDVAVGGAIAGALERFWADGGLAVEGRYWIGRAQTVLDESAHPSVACRLWLALCRLSDAKHKRDAAERALALCEPDGDNHNTGWAHLFLGDSLAQTGRLAEARVAYTRALDLMRAFGDQRGVALCLGQLSYILCSCGDVAAGRDMFAQALEACKVLGDDAQTAIVLRNLAECEFADDHPQEALRLADEALAIRARGKNAKHLAIDYNNSAAYRLAMGDLGGAREAVRQALRAAREAEFALGIAIASQHAALLSALRRQTQGAARLLGYVDVRYNQLGYECESTEKWSYEKLVGALRANLTEVEIETLAADGAGWSEKHAIEEALKV